MLFNPAQVDEGEVPLFVLPLQGGPGGEGRSRGGGKLIFSSRRFTPERGGLRAQTELEEAVLSRARPHGGPLDSLIDSKVLVGERRSANAACLLACTHTHTSAHILALEHACTRCPPQLHCWLEALEWCQRA